MNEQTIRTATSVFLLLFASLSASGQGYPNTAKRAPDTGKVYVLNTAAWMSAQYYGVTHGGSTIAITGVTFNKGNANFTLNVYIDNWRARNSEGIFDEEIWVEQSNGSWPGLVLSTTGVTLVGATSGTPPPGLGSWSFSQSFSNTPPGTQFRVFGYAYMYNQGGSQQGEYALYSWMGPVTVPSPAQMTPPVSANATLTYGQSWSPSVSGGEGTGGYVFCIAGQTNFAPVSSKWVANPPGTYNFYVGQLPDGTNVGTSNDPNIGNFELNSTPYTLTVNKAPMTPPSGLNAAIAVGQTWTPTISGGTPGAGPYVFAVTGQTNFGSSPATLTTSWTPTNPGTYSFHVGQQATGNYSGNVIDPNVGPIELNPSGYSVIVNPLPMTAPTSSNAMIALGQTFTPSYFGGTGTGPYVFAVAGYTNYGSSPTTLATSWTPAGVGIYSFYVGQKSDATHTGNANDPNIGNFESNSSPYTLTVNPIGTTFAASPLSFIYNGSVQGPTVSPSPVNASYVAAGTTSAINSGTYSFTVTATGNYSGSNAITWNINPANQPSISLVPATPSIAAGQSVIFTASGGSGTGTYVWGGSASGSGSSNSVLFSNVGTYAVTVHRAADSNHSASANATATISVNPAAATFSGLPVSFTYNGSAQSPTLIPTPVNATYSTIGTTSAISAGNYSFTVSASGNYSGSDTIFWSIGPANQAPVSISPVNSSVMVGQSITFIASGGSGAGAYVWAGAASGTGASTTVSFNSPGTTTVTLVKSGDSNYNPSNTAAASVTVTVPQYTLSTATLGNGAVTAGGTYPANTILSITATPGANAYFTGWTGSLTSSANPLPITMTADLTVDANFAAMQAQTITFAPPATLAFPGPALILGATASSGLPVTFSLISGPGLLAGNQLSLTGAGPVVLQASQAGNALWLAAPATISTITVTLAAPVVRIRFNPAGREGRVVDGGHSGSSLLWTDPAGLQASPWPSFANPAAASVRAITTVLPAPPIAPSGIK